MEVSKKQKHITSGITIHYPALRGVWVNTFLHLKHVYLPSLAERVNTSRLRWIASVCQVRLCVQRSNNEIRYAHHQQDKNASLGNYCDLRGKIFRILKFFAHFPLRISKARNISYLRVCVGTPGVSDGLKARSDWKKTFISLQAKDTSDCETTRLWKHLHLYSETINELKM